MPMSAINSGVPEGIPAAAVMPNAEQIKQMFTAYLPLM